MSARFTLVPYTLLNGISFSYLTFANYVLITSETEIRLKTAEHNLNPRDLYIMSKNIKSYRDMSKNIKNYRDLFPTVPVSEFEPVHCTVYLILYYLLIS